MLKEITEQEVSPSVQDYDIVVENRDTRVYFGLKASEYDLKSLVEKMRVLRERFLKSSLNVLIIIDSCHSITPSFLFHEIAHKRFFPNDDLDVYSYYYDFRRASSLSHSLEIELLLQQILDQMWASDAAYIVRPVFNPIDRYYVNHCLSVPCPYEPPPRAIENQNRAKPPQTHYQALAEQLAGFISHLQYLIALLKKIVAELIRLQYLAYQAHNRISSSPTPQKKEPPVGGVKIGGKQHEFFRHVAEILYLKPIFMLNQAAVP